ncbi:MAG: kelch repeat-containing protein [Flavobacterium sp.]|uniref:Kelch repeat-containing protein n=1 Tax=Flavobacterium sp. TaxID=239 RepID=UPI002628D33F|nr:kelch repeat-containing protein [Flavobacterium sp.]MDD5149239.1 kelch repeat-containing protein [Flavobacterium sp.]
MIKLKKVLTLVTILIGLFMTSCSNSDNTEDLVGNWIKKSSFDGPARSSSASFVIGNDVYVATGYTGDVYLNDLWSYTSDGDFWEQKADFIGVKRSSASAFEINGKGYVGLGYDGSNRLKDFYEYNPSTNTWTQKADFAGSARYGAVGFQVANKAFFGTGYDGNYLKDFYQYNPTTDVWTLSPGFGGNKRKNATVFIINDNAYLVTGISNNVMQYDFWLFNGTNESWTKLRDIDRGDSGEYNEDYQIIRANASSFVMNGLGYVACGDNSTTVWQYTPTTDLWKEKTSLEASGRIDAVGVSLNNRGFIMLGRSGTSYFDDSWEFKPNDEQVDND